jgi:chorismate mutase
MDQPTITGEKELEDCRRQIDELDTELLRLLNQRAAIACEIALIKVASGLPAFDGNRERQVLARVAEKNTGPLDQRSVIDIFSGIIREIRRLGTQRMQEASEIPKRSEGSLDPSDAAGHQPLPSAKRNSFP